MEMYESGFKDERSIVTPYSIRQIQANSPMSKGLHITHIGYYPHAKYHMRERPLGAKENVLIYCDQGKGWIEHRGDKHILSSNNLYILPANEAHAYGAMNNDPWSIYWMHFEGKDTKLFDSIIGKKIVIKHEHNSRISDRLIIFEEIFQNLNMGYSIENLEFSSICLRMFLASIKYIHQYREIKNMKIDDVVSTCIRFMKNHMEDKLSLDDIAANVGYSTSHLNTLFLSKTGFTPIVYYNQLRIQRVCHLLQFSELRIKEIAYKLGFCDPFHLSNAFVKEMNITPREYRKRYKD